MPAETTPAPTSAPRYGNMSDLVRKYLFVLICLTALVNFLDRQIFAILLEPMKHDLGVSDTAMGFLTGGAFALVYTAAGIPLALWVDRGRRRIIMGTVLMIWSAMTLVCSGARTYSVMMLGRMGVAVGEAGSMPASYSMIPDLYPPAKRAGVIGTLYFAGGLGIAISLALGGYLEGVIGWRGTLVAAAIPGIILSLLFFFTVREPQRMGVAAKSSQIWAAFRDAWSYPSYRYVAAIATLSSFAGYGILGWAPTFLIRVHGLTPATVGQVMGFGMLCGAIGSFTSGRFADRLARRDVRWLFGVSALGPLISLPGLVYFLYGDMGAGLVAAYAVYQFLFGAWQPACFAVVVTVTNSQNRGLATQIITIFQNLGGVALGPVAIGLLNDNLFQSFGHDGIRYSLTAIASAIIGVILLAALAVRSVKADYLKADRRNAADAQ